MRALIQSLLSVRREHGRLRGKMVRIALVVASLFVLSGLGCHRKLSAATTAASARTSVSSASTGSAIPSASASAGPVVFPNGYRPRRPVDDAGIGYLSKWGPTSAGFRPNTGDGTKQPMRLGLKGYVGETSVRGSLRLFKRHVTVDLRRANGRKYLTLEGNVQDEQEWQSSNETTAVVVTRLNGKPAPEDTTLQIARELYAYRTQVSGSVTQDEESIDLWETLSEEPDWFDKHDKLLGSRISVPYDALSIMEVAEDESVMLTQTIGSSGKPILVALGKKPEHDVDAVRHVEVGDLFCGSPRCETSVNGYRLAPDLCVFVVRLDEEVCGMRCHSESFAELVVLTKDGFVTGPTLDASDNWPALDEDSVSHSHTKLSWIDADGTPPVEILMTSEATRGHETSQTAELLGYDPARKGFVKREGYSSAALREIAKEFEDAGAFEEY